MSSNNLGAQLEWLLRVKPFIPSAAAFPPTSLADQHAHSAQEFPHRVSPVRATGKAKEEEPKEMVRLRTQPSPQRIPRLLAHQSCPDPVGASLFEDSDESGLGSSKKRAVSTRFVDIHAEPPSPSPTRVRPKATPARQQEYSHFLSDAAVETIDLTSGSAKDRIKKNHASQVANFDNVEPVPLKPFSPPSVAGKKRKSSEMEPGPRSPLRGQPSNAVRSNVLEAAEEGDFVPIDDDPPPPYSTRVPNEDELGYAQYFSQSSAEGDDSQKKRPKSSNDAGPSVIKQSPASSGRQLQDFPPPAIAASPPKPTKASTQEPKKESTQTFRPISDSEEETEAVFQQTPSRSHIDRTVKAPITPPGKEASASANVSAVRQHSQAPNTQVKTDPVPSTHTPPPSRPPITSTATARRKLLSARTGLLYFHDSKPTFTAFCQVDEEHLSKHLNTVEAEKKSAARKRIELDEADELTDELQTTLMNKIRSCLRQVKAIQQLLEERKDYYELCQRKLELKEQRIAVTEMGEDDSGLKVEENALLPLLAQKEADIVELLSIAELPASLSKVTPAAASEQKNSVAVHSTQAGSSIQPRASPYPPQASISKTQLVQQTQAPLRETRNEMFGDHEGISAPNFTNATFGDFDDDDDDDADMMNAATTAEGKAHFASQGSVRPPLAESSGNARQHTTPNGREAESQEVNFSNPEFQKPWSTEVVNAMKHKFRMSGFRRHQLDAINTTLSGEDVFVLMPTGGGKSLCYQLPSIIKGGRSSGVTVVVSPLLSLMEDQVSHMQRLDIQAFVINSETPHAVRQKLLSTLRESNVQQVIQLLYITPELVSKSAQVVNALKAAYDNNQLARIVIDEAHCVSQWGHDFRPDYKLLGDFRAQFPSIPAMALTATATDNVLVDVRHNLNLSGSCKVFKQSFNRPNLSYKVLPKQKNKQLVENIANIINTEHLGQCGIIYCLSRDKCEKVAEELREEYNIRAQHYHAMIDPDEKRAIQRDWQDGKFNVIVATIAFGMGIDKPDVRFVIHHGLPKSLEGYYQETGRAGRDGRRSNCYLFFGMQDVYLQKKFIQDSDGSIEQQERQMQMLTKVISYCREKYVCRRAQVLEYFGEKFNSEDCKGSCDNCASRGSTSFETVDFTQYATKTIQFLADLERRKKRITLIQCVDILRGKNTSKALAFEDCDGLGMCMDLERDDVERLLYRLVSLQALEEESTMNRMGFPIQYLKIGKRHEDYSVRSRKLEIQVRVSPNGKRPKQRKINTTGLAAPLPLSTNVSSPVQAKSKRRQVRVQEDPEEDNDSFFQVQQPRHGRLDEYRHDDFVIPDEEVDDDGDYQQPAKSRSTIKTTRRRPLGEPISQDAQMASLPQLHQEIVSQFLEGARKLCRNLQLKHNLRGPPFSDLQLRQMAIDFPYDIYEMRNIDGIDFDKVQLYGKHFVKPIQEAKNMYEALMTRNEERPEDPNHQHVINLCSEDEGASFDIAAEASDNEFDDGGELSCFFNQDERTRGFNAELQQLQPQEQPAREYNNAANSYGDGKSRSGRGGSSSKGKRKFNNKRASSEGPSRGGRVTKRKASTGARKPSGGGSHASSVSRGGSNNRGGSAGRGRQTRIGNSFNTGGIMMMPT